MRFTVSARSYACASVVAFCLAIAGLAPAQTIPNYNPTPTILHTWTTNENPSEGQLAKDSAGNIYGYNTTTVNNDGTDTFYSFLFKLTNLQNGSYSYSVPFTFASNYSLYNTATPVLDASGNIFGTAFDKNNTNSPGVLFELVNSGGNYTFQVLYTFVQGVDSPPNRLMMDASGNLYGATPAQLTCCTAGEPTVTGYGNVYEFVNNNGAYSKKVLYDYSSSNNAAGSFGLLTMDAAGNLFDIGDEANYSTEDVVELVKGADGSYTERLLYRETNESINLFAPLTVDANDNLFLATTYVSGSNDGAVVELANNNGSYSLQTLYSFTGGADGSYPQTPLVFDASGNLYGTTSYGGSVSGSSGAGTVFALVPGSGGYQLKTLYTFNGTTDGGSPESGILFDQNYNIFGVTNGFYNGTTQVHSPPTIFELLNQTANATTTTVTASPTSVGLATPVTLTATVAPASGGSLPSGTITFTEGSITLGSAEVSGGTASLTLTSDFLGLGTDTITATFTASGGNTGANSSGVATVTVTESNLAQISGGNTFSGNQNVNGSVTATSFAGDGSGLTNVTASALNCVGCVTNTQLGVNYAGSTTQGGPATSAITAQTALTAGSATTAATANNAIQLGGLPASAYALAGANSFTGNQTITGNVTSTGSVTAQSASFSSSVTTGGVTLSPTATATASQSFASSPIAATASAFNSSTSAPESLGFALQTVPVAATNNTSNPAVTLNLLYGANGSPAPTGLSFNADGTINFASNQKFPIPSGVGTITGVAAGPGLTGGGTSGNVTLSLAPQSCPAGTALSGISSTGQPLCTAFASTTSNTFVGQQVMQSLNVTNGVTTNSVTIGGGTAIQGYFSVTIPVTLPALPPGTCMSYHSAAIAGFTPGDTDTFAIGAPSALTASLHAPAPHGPGDKDDDRDWDHPYPGPALFLSYQAWETSTTANPTISLEVCNSSNSPYQGGFTGNFRVDIFKH